jgi:hypothetical protein
VFENRVLRRIFGPKRDDVTGVRNEEWYIYLIENIIRMIRSKTMRRAGHVAGMGEKRNWHSVLVKKPEGKRPLGGQRRKWVDNIKIDPG